MKTRSRTKPKYKKSLIFLLLAFFLFGLVYYLHLVHGLLLFNVLNFSPKYQWKEEYGHLNGPDISATDPLVISKFLQSFLFPPKNLPYNLTSDDVQFDPSMGQSIVIRRLFKNFQKKSPGFFIECGALDGETRSNTLYLERALHWKGLLIEADPQNYKMLEKKNRQCFISPTCLSTKGFPTMVSFEQKENQGKIASFGVGYLQNGFVDVQCFPFESMMTAMNVSTIDYFSLDVEGLELKILRTVPFEKYNIRTLSVEYIHDAEGKEAIRDFMTSMGYVVHSEITHPNWLANDFIFVKKTFYDSFSQSEKDNIKKDIEAQSETLAGNIVVSPTSNHQLQSLSADFVNDPV